MLELEHLRVTFELQAALQASHFAWFVVVGNLSIEVQLEFN